MDEESGRDGEGIGGAERAHGKGRKETQTGEGAHGKTGWQLELKHYGDTPAADKIGQNAKIAPFCALI